MTSQTKKDGDVSIAIFGLSANPPTGDEGHVGIVRHLVESDSFDERKRRLERYDHRLAMCKICFEALSSSKTIVRVLPLERDAYEAELARNESDPYSRGVPPARLGTIDIISFVREDTSSVMKKIRKEVSNSREGNHAFDLHLVLGYDTFLDLMRGKWKDSESLISQVTLEVFQREGILSESESLEENFLPKLLRANINRHHVASLGSVSSTSIRAWNPSIMEDLCNILTNINPNLAGYFQGIQGSKIPSNQINASVFNYIRDNNLYFYSIQSLRKRFIFNFLRLIFLIVLIVMMMIYSMS